MIDLFGRMIRLPLFLVTSGIDAFANMLRQVQVSIDQGLESISPAHRTGRDNLHGARMPIDDGQSRAKASVADPHCARGRHGPDILGGVFPRPTFSRKPNRHVFKARDPCKTINARNADGQCATANATDRCGTQT